MWTTLSPRTPPNLLPHLRRPSRHAPLPVELQLRILELAGDHPARSKKTRARLLLRLSLVARQVGGEAQRMLWRNVQLRSLQRVHAVEGVLAKRRDLRGAVRTLEVRGEGLPKAGSYLLDLMLWLTRLQQLDVEHVEDFDLGAFRHLATLERIHLRRCRFRLLNPAHAWSVV